MTTTSCATSRMAVPTPATLPSALRYSAPNRSVPTNGDSSIRPDPGTMSKSSSLPSSYARTYSFLLRSIRLAFSRAPSSTSGLVSDTVSAGSRMSLANSVSHLGSNRFSRTCDPGWHTNGYGTTGMENSPGSASPS